MAVDYATLKKGGFMRQKQKNNFSLRLRVVGGNLTAKQLAKIAEVSENYGDGYVHLTSRQSVEIPFVKLDDVEAVKDALAEGDVEPGVCGPRVRTITACQGEAICPSGCIDTYALAKELDDRYFAKELPHKFKFGITGCQNNCHFSYSSDSFTFILSTACLKSDFKSSMSSMPTLILIVSSNTPAFLFCFSVP